MKYYLFFLVFLFIFNTLADSQEELCKAILAQNPQLVQKALEAGATMEGPCGMVSASELAEGINRETDEFVRVEGAPPAFNGELPDYFVRQGDFLAGWVSYEKPFLILPQLPKIGELTVERVIFRLHDEVGISLKKIKDLQSAYLKTPIVELKKSFTGYSYREQEKNYRNLALLQEKIAILRAIQIELTKAISNYSRLRKEEAENIEIDFPQSQSEQKDDFLKAMISERNKLESDIDSLQSFFEYGTLYLIDPGTLKSIAGKTGLTDAIRPYVWQMIIGYLPATNSRFAEVRKQRVRYKHLLKQRFPNGLEDFSQIEEAKRVQLETVKVDIPRTLNFFKSPKLRISLKKVLMQLAVEQEYLQGLNEVAKQLMMTFAKSYYGLTVENETFSAEALSDEELNSLEADTLWCMTRILEPVYKSSVGYDPFALKTFDGVEVALAKLMPKLSAKTKEFSGIFLSFVFEEGITFFARLLPPNQVQLVWDSYLLEPGKSGFAALHHFFIMAMLEKSKSQLLAIDSMEAFQDFLKKVLGKPTYTFKEISNLIARAKALREEFERQ